MNKYNKSFFLQEMEYIRRYRFEFIVVVHIRDSVLVEAHLFIYVRSYLFALSRSVFTIDVTRY